MTTAKAPDKISLIKRRHLLEGKRKDAAAKLKEIEEQVAEVDGQLLELLEAAGEEKVQIKGGLGIQLRSSVVPTVKDWDSFYAWIKKNNAFYMLERRPSVTGYRDVLASGKAIPGVDSFTKTKVALIS